MSAERVEPTSTIDPDYARLAIRWMEEDTRKRCRLEQTVERSKGRLAFKNPITVGSLVLAALLISSASFWPPTQKNNEDQKPRIERLRIQNQNEFCKDYVLKDVRIMCSYVVARRQAEIDQLNDSSVMIPIPKSTLGMDLVSGIKYFLDPMKFIQIRSPHS